MYDHTSFFDIFRAIRYLVSRDSWPRRL